MTVSVDGSTGSWIFLGIIETAARCGWKTAEFSGRDRCAEYSFLMSQCESSSLDFQLLDFGHNEPKDVQRFGWNRFFLERRLSDYFERDEIIGIIAACTSENRWKEKINRVRRYSFWCELPKGQNCQSFYISDIKFKYLVLKRWEYFNFDVRNYIFVLLFSNVKSYTLNITSWNVGKNVIENIFRWKKLLKSLWGIVVENVERGN